MRYLLLATILWLAIPQARGQYIFYGLSTHGGSHQYGALFSFHLQHAQAYQRVDFGRAAGAHPQGTLLRTADGQLYGTTCKGGNFDRGLLFRFDPALNLFTPILHLDGAGKGANPQGGLTEGPDGRLYLLCPKGGAHGLGTLLAIDLKQQIMQKLADFDGTSLGSHPRSNLALLADGWLYGSCSAGGRQGAGTLFRLHPQSGKSEKVADFSADSSGRAPQGNLVVGKDGRLYGLCIQGGSQDMGTCFRLEGGKLQKVADFDGPVLGGKPWAGGLLGADGWLYGMAHDGGGHGNGTLFRISPTGGAEKLVDFDGRQQGGKPLGGLVQTPHGQLYGLTSVGGLFTHGTMFEYDIGKREFKKLLDLEADLGQHPGQATLAWAPTCLDTAFTQQVQIPYESDYIFPDRHRVRLVQRPMQHVSEVTTPEGCRQTITTVLELKYPD